VIRVAAPLVLALALAAPAAAQDVHLAVVVGLAGEPEHGEAFSRWAATLVDAASGRMGVPRENIVYLTEKPDEDSTRANGKSTKAEVDRAFAALAQKAAADDVVMAVLIGHGTFDGKVAKFNLPGPDMTPADFAPLLARLKSRHVVFVNTSSASGPFLAELSGPGRTIITATRSGSEKFATLFGGYFIDALTGQTADMDKNGRISMLEAFNAAKLEVGRAYEREGLMLTEHPLLDDSGDKSGSGDPSATGTHGRVASVVALGRVAPAPPLPDDPKLRGLIEEQRELERRVEALKLLKSGMEPARYASELEKLLTDLALKGRQIREAGGKQ
jgi:hypothetical protein